MSDQHDSLPVDDNTPLGDIIHMLDSRNDSGALMTLGHGRDAEAAFVLLHGPHTPSLIQLLEQAVARLDAGLPLP
ncbi:hypothetical protein [Parachitinimonas caeni]|uniref:Uncharacterized protein n=1 Tax=Parachitinimonas caeni TaxID=3031301 RepID=A0ABT7E1R8_9NEIS|nr:hypothetical protein [Parachitinimonas caeni]MDK2126256.1 hypothetical protein [Parachitinimonas caeni]